jgi:hypothetical protein
MADTKPYRIAILWRGDREAREAATPQNNRFHRIFEELMALGIHAEPAWGSMPDRSWDHPKKIS